MPERGGARELFGGLHLVENSPLIATYLSMVAMEMKLFGRLREIANNSPQKISVIEQDNVTTYEKLCLDAEKLAERLDGLGGGPGDVVAIIGQASIDYFISILACFRNCYTALLIDSSQPEARVQIMIKEARCRFMLTLQDAISIINLDMEGASDRCDTDILTTSAHYMLFTSGTTGFPKAIKINELSLLNLIDSFQEKRPLKCSDVGSLWCSIGFDVSLYEVFSILLAGGTVQIFPPNLRPFGTRFLNWLADVGVTSVYLPPFVLREFEARCSSHFQNMTRILVGVEPIRHDVLHSIKSKIPHVTLLNGYGPTETTICATAHEVLLDETETNQYCPIGSALHGYDVRVLDSENNEVASGEIGEIYISAVHMTTGYENSKELMCAKFVHLTPADNCVYFRTGDLAKVDARGSIHFCGRSDSQVKFRGNRVELLDIKFHIETYHSVTECFVELHEAKNPLIIAHMLVEEEIYYEDIIDYLRDRLPSYMIPAQFYIYAEFLRTINGKFDVASLTKKGIPLKSRIPHVSPKNSIENILCAYFCNLLNVKEIGVTANLYYYGLDSLNIAIALVEVERISGRELNAFKFSQIRTVSEIVSLLDCSGEMLG